MYQDHLHKITDDSEKQRMKRDQLIESLKKNMSTTDAELKKTRSKQETDRYVSFVRNNHSCVFFLLFNVRSVQKTYLSISFTSQEENV